LAGGNFEFSKREFPVALHAAMPHLHDKNVLLKLYNLLKSTPAASGS